jgi:type IV pilus assembly protein PilA
MAANWFYADAQNQQQGPVERSWFASAYRNGTITPATLVWREGLAGWVPLTQAASELHLVIVGGPPPLTRQQGSAPPRIVKPASSSGMLIVIILAVCFIPFIAIIAAITLPAYQDYTLRSKIAGAVVLADGLKIDVAEFFELEKRCPQNGEAGIGEPETYATPVVAAIHVGTAKPSGECSIRVVFKSIGGSVSAGNELTWMLNDKGAWHTTSDLPPRYLPASMRPH